MKSLLLIAHGSRRQQSNQEVTLLAKKLHSHCSEQYAFVHSAFLEFAAPLIPEGIKKCIDDGADSITILPYFLNSGHHVIRDIPRIVSSVKQKYPGIDIKIAQHLGGSSLMMSLLIDSASKAE